MKLPTRTNIKKILNRYELSRSYTDKRANGNRIKISTRLFEEEIERIQKELSKEFPHLDIVVKLIDSKFTSGGSRICTAIYSSVKPS
jgi:hypothetical protein